VSRALPRAVEVIGDRDADLLGEGSAVAVADVEEVVAAVELVDGGVVDHAGVPVVAAAALQRHVHDLERPLGGVGDGVHDLRVCGPAAEAAAGQRAVNTWTFPSGPSIADEPQTCQSGSWRMRPTGSSRCAKSDIGVVMV
jgi:hypothetical protein